MRQSGKLRITERGFSKFLKLPLTYQEPVLPELNLNSQFYPKSGRENSGYDVIETLPGKTRCGKLTWKIEKFWERKF